MFYQKKKNKKKHIFFFLYLLVIFPVMAEEKIVLAFDESTFSPSVGNFAAPYLAIYDNGLVIQKIIDYEKRTSEVKTTIISKSQLNAIKRKIDKLIGKSVIEKKRYEANYIMDIEYVEDPVTKEKVKTERLCMITCQPITTFYVDTGKTKFKTELFGAETGIETKKMYPEISYEATIPKGLLETYEYVKNLAFKNLTDYNPEYFKITLHKKSYYQDGNWAPARYIECPEYITVSEIKFDEKKEWRGFSIKVPIKYYEEFISSFEDKLKYNEASEKYTIIDDDYEYIKINNLYYAINWHLYYPGENCWDRIDFDDD